MDTRQQSLQEECRYETRVRDRNHGGNGRRECDIRYSHLVAAKSGVLIASCARDAAAKHPAVHFSGHAALARKTDRPAVLDVGYPGIAAGIGFAVAADFFRSVADFDPVAERVVCFVLVGRAAADLATAVVVAAVFAVRVVAAQPAVAHVVARLVLVVDGRVEAAAVDRGPVDLVAVAADDFARDRVVLVVVQAAVYLFPRPAGLTRRRR